MKIVMAHYKYYVQGGPERYLFKFTKLAESHGHTVIPFSVNYPQNEKTPYAKYFVNPAGENSTGRFDASKLTLSSTVKGTLRQFHNREAVKKLKELIAEEQPDLLYVLIPGMLSADIFKVAKQAGIPVMMRLSDFRMVCGCNILLKNGEPCEKCLGGHLNQIVKGRCVKGSLPLSLLRKSSLAYNRRHKVYHRVDAVIVPSDFTRDILLRDGILPANKLRHNPTFVTVKNLPSERGDYLFCPGRFSPEKGFAYAVEAMKYLRDLPLRLAVTGDKENCDPSLKKIIEENGIGDKILFTGFLSGERLDEYYAGSFAVLCPSICYENMPNTVIEGYAFGKPVIGSDIGSIHCLIEDGKTGYLVPPRSAGSIADAVRRLYEDPAAYEAMCRQAEERCREEFSPEKHWERFTDICRDIGVKL